MQILSFGNEMWTERASDAERNRRPVGEKVVNLLHIRQVVSFQTCFFAFKAFLVLKCYIAILVVLRNQL